MQLKQIVKNWVFMTQRELMRANLIAGLVQTILRYLHFNPLPQAMHKIVKSLPSNKAPGCDKVRAKILKDSSPVVAPIITSLTNNSFTLNSFTLPWKKAEIVPFLNPRTVRSLLTRDQYRYSLFYLKYAKEQLTCSLPISSIQTMSYTTCKVEIENFTQPSLR